MARISADELSKAINSLAESLELTERTTLQDIEVQNALRDACIQRFEYSIELSWKTSMRLLGSAIAGAKPAIREMARNNLIDNPDVWLEFIDARNDTSHAYDENIAIRVFENAKRFLPEARKLVVNLDSIK